jgi:WD40 repeat protein
MTGMRMKLWVCGLLLCLAACTVNMGANPTVPASETPEPTATITPIPTETATPSPSATSTTTLTPTLTATPRPVIHAGNAGFLGQVFQIPHPDSRSLVFAPDSTWLLIGSGNASSGNNLVSMWWPDQEQLINLAPAATTVWEAAFSPDGYEAAYVVDNPGQDLRGYVVDVGARREIAALKGTGTAYSLAYSPDGKRLALGGLGVYPNGVIWIYDTADWAVLQELPVNGQNVLDLVYSPDGSRLYSTGTDGRIRVWDPAGGKLLLSFQKGKQANRIALSPEGSFLASITCTTSDAFGCVKGGVTIWKAADGKILKTFTDIARSIAFSPDGSLFATGGDFHDPAVRLRYTATWNLVGEAASMADCLAFSPDGRLLASADDDSVTIWSIR